MGDQGLGEDAVVGVEVLGGALGDVGVQLDLVHGANDLGLLDQLLQGLGSEVGHSDRADLVLVEEVLQSRVGADRLVEVRRQGLVQDEQVDLVDAEFAGTLLPRVQVVSSIHPGRGVVARQGSRSRVG